MWRDVIQAAVLKHVDTNLVGSKVKPRIKVDVSAQPSLLDSGDKPWATPGHVGIDEVGIGPLAGPVVAAAVLLDPQHPIEALADSKMLTPGKRHKLAEQLRTQAPGWALGWASVAEVDELNVLRASHLAMQRAFQKLYKASVADHAGEMNQSSGRSIVPTFAWIDGNKLPALSVPCQAVIQGDKLIPQISAASILAKVARDAYMVELEDAFPGYGFARHKGYPTRQHIQALTELGATEHHRRSFAPVKKVLTQIPHKQIGHSVA